MNTLIKISLILQKTFPIWIIGASAIALLAPEFFAQMIPYSSWILGIIMLGMGMTMTPASFKEVLKQPKAVAVGLIAQFVIMPSTAYALAIGLDFPKPLAIGVILVGCCPSGTASNVITYLAKGNTSLSITCSCLATLLAPLITPALFYLLASEWLEIDAWAMFKSIITIVLLPAMLGMLLRVLFRKTVDACLEVTPIISVLGIAIILMGIVGANKDALFESGLEVFAIVVLHNALGLLLGYWAAKLFRLKEPDSRAISIEVGMQNSGLAVALAAAHFAAMPLAALPSAIFSVWHNVSGSMLASYWRRK